MDIKQAFRTGLRNLQADKTYLFQTMLGIVIGVAALMSALVAAQGMVYVAESIAAELSPNMLRFMIQTRVENPNRLTPADMQQLVDDNLELFKSVSPDVFVLGGLKYGDKLLDGEFGVDGVGEDFDQIFSAIKLAEGRWLLPMDIEREQNVCVVGSDMQEVIGADMLGAAIKIQGENYTVVGVLQEADNDMMDVNKQIYIPYTNAYKLHNDCFNANYFENGGYWDLFYFRLTDTANMRQAYKTIYDFKNERLGRDAMSVIYNHSEFIGAVYEGIAPIVITLAFITVMVLLVGGAGVMNVMLLAVGKRTPEIGVRKAFGATDRDISRQFVAESSCISLFGGALGIVFGWAGSYFVCGMVHVPFNFDFLPLAAITSFIVTVAIGMLFGLRPAKQAAKLEPVAAINAH